MGKLVNIDIEMPAKLTEILTKLDEGFYQEAWYGGFIAGVFATSITLIILWIFFRGEK